MLLKQLSQKQMKLHFKLAVAQRRGGGSHLGSRCGAPSVGDGVGGALWAALADVLMTDVALADVTWPHSWNSVCGGSDHRFLVV